jgi:hypothetical protein
MTNKLRTAKGQVMPEYLLVTAAIVFFLWYPDTRPAFVNEFISALVDAYQKQSQAISMP